MKIGVRKPSLKKSIKARTTGKMKRKLKKSINPLYGKKGMGWVNNPKKAMYNKVYNKTTVGVSDLVRGAANTSKSANRGNARVRQTQGLKADVMSLKRVYKNRFIGWTLFSVIGGWCFIFPIFLAVKYYKKHKGYKDYIDEL